ncbi:GapS4b family protein [Bacillus paranthracis]|uniref:GapS4b family protein n=1 Tax=Bacillus paranthracis TaxID=2026186 RepID=UPI003DA81917
MSDKEQNHVDVEAILPYGEMLRPLIVSSALSKNDLKRTLARRGIFVSNKQLDHTVPLLLTTILSPREFEELREKQRTKEDNIKRKTQSIVWNNEETLLDAVEELGFDIHTIVHEEDANFEVQGDPDFRVEQRNPNELAMRYQIERRDLTKNWVKHKSIHEGNIVFQRQENGNVKIIMEHTSNETKEVNEKVKTHLVKSFKEKGFIGSEELIEKITASRFSNEKRNEFLISLLCDDDSGSLVFKEVTNVEIGPDSTKDSLPDEIEWMKEHVKNLILKGQSLHSMNFFKNEDWRNAIIIQEVEAVFEYKFRNISGNCKINFGFPSLLKSLNGGIEFEINTQVILGANYAHVNKKEVEKFIFNTFDAIKDKIKIRHLEEQTV